MTKRSGAVFLPQVIDAWGGIENWISGNRDGMRSVRRYPTFYDSSRPATVCGWILRRLARSGRVTVEAANAVMYLAAVRYSGAPERTYAAIKVCGYGRLVIGENDGPAASVPIWSTVRAADAATDEAQAQRRAHSDLQTRMLWREGGDRYEELKPCRWCGEPVQFKEEWKEFDGSVRCNRRDCRRMDYLRHVPQSKGGIDLTPRQRQGLSYDAWNTQRTINYLALVAKEQKRGRKSNHDVR